VNQLTGQLVQYGRHRQRRSFSRISEVLELPNLIEIQTSSYQWFLDEGLREMFQDIGIIRIHKVIRYRFRQPIAQGQHLAHPGLADTEYPGDVIVC